MVDWAFWDLLLTVGVVVFSAYAVDALKPIYRPFFRAENQKILHFLHLRKAPPDPIESEFIAEGLPGAR